MFRVIGKIVYRPCPACKGTGRDQWSEYEDACPDCYGDGIVEVGEWDEPEPEQETP